MDHQTTMSSGLAYQLEVAITARSAHPSVILFFNECDTLQRKFDSGIVVKDYMPSYGDQANFLTLSNLD